MNCPENGILKVPENPQSTLMIDPWPAMEEASCYVLGSGNMWMILLL